jgi:hypothetical protein
MTEPAHPAPADEDRIDADDESQRRRWARTFGVSEEELLDAVRTVGAEVEKVREFFQGGGNRVP